MTQLQSARMGFVTEAMKIVAADEGIEAERVCAAIATGEAVIPLNIHHINAKAVGVGRLFKTKINANLGRSAMRQRWITVLLLLYGDGRREPSTGRRNMQSAWLWRQEENRQQRRMRPDPRKASSVLPSPDAQAHRSSPG